MTGRTRKWSTCLLAAAMALWTWGGVNVARADEGDPVAKALAVDIARDAAESGVDPDLLESRLEFQREVDAVLDPLIEKYADTYSAAGYTEDKRVTVE